MDAVRERTCLEVRRQETCRQEVDVVARAPAKRPRLHDFGDAGQRGLNYEAVEIDGTPRYERGVDDGADRMRQHRHVWSKEALPLASLHRPEIHDRLKLDVVVLFEGEEVVEDLAFGDLRRLSHADPAAEPGDCDGVAESQDVSLGGGQRRIDVGQSIRGRLGDRPYERFRQLTGVRQHAPA